MKNFMDNFGPEVIVIILYGILAIALINMIALMKMCW